MRKRTERDFTDSNTDESNKPEKREREKRQPFQVNPTSVSNHGGVGLYSNKGFKKGQRLPFRYPGIHLSKEKFEQLNDFLFALQKQDFFVGDMVSVNLSRLKNYRDFLFSHMDGIVESRKFTLFGRNKYECW